ncbi:MAG TPA: flagellar hook capping FlgD N-terminal domain-containing protein [Paracoccus sp. (in: a-proteobacteria)]|nr:flagellar hook capping FlgD N-terminal domain-containing protein [Paracoccus sp. (in: a-proteobacteria)]
MDLTTSAAAPPQTGNPAAAGGTAAGTSPAEGRAGSFASGDFETFLKMLTTQIRNQDPLNPMEGSDFAVQLATFSGVEQQVRTNQLLAAMAGSQAGGLGALAGWLGKEVRTTAPLAFDGTPLTLDIQPARNADAVTLVTLDPTGREVLREDIGTGTGEIDWAGRRTDDTLLPPGRYSFRIESTRGGAVIETANVGAWARVTGAETTADGIRLTLPGGASTLESQVTALREDG